MGDNNQFIVSAVALPFPVLLFTQAPLYTDPSTLSVPVSFAQEKQEPLP